MTQRFFAFAIAALAVACLSDDARADLLEDIGSQTSTGKAVFLVVTDAKAEGLAGAREVAAKAHAQVSNSSVLEVNRSDPAQADAVKRLRISGAPVPLILVIAPNGLAVGAVRPAAENAVPRLVKMVPTAAKAQYLKVLSKKKVACVLFHRKDMAERGPVLQQIASARRTPELAMDSVMVDLDDKNESRFIKEWKLDIKKVKRPLLVFVNPKGQIIGKLEGMPNAIEIIRTARATVSGCACGKAGCKGHK